MHLLVADHWSSRTCANRGHKENISGNWRWVPSSPIVSLLGQGIEQNYPNYPLGPADQSSVEGLLFQIRATTFPAVLKLVLAHPSSKQAFLPSPLAFPLLFRWEVSAFLPTRLHLHCCPCIFAHATILPSLFLPGWGRLVGEKSGVVSSLLVPWPCFTPVPTAVFPVVLVPLNLVREVRERHCAENSSSKGAPLCPMSFPPLPGDPHLYLFASMFPVFSNLSFCHTHTLSCDISAAWVAVVFVQVYKPSKQGPQRKGCFFHNNF